MEPAAKKHRAEVPHVTPRKGSLVNVETSAMTLTTLTSAENFPADSSLVILVYDSRSEDKSLNAITTDEWTKRFAVPLVAFDGKLLCEAREKEHLVKEISSESHTNAHDNKGIVDKDEPLVLSSDGAVILSTSDLSELPRLVLLHRDASNENKTEKRLSKHVVNTDAVAATALVEPVFHFEHMVRLMERSSSSKLHDEKSDSYSILWMSASWCPPCMRIMQVLPSMIPEFPSAVSTIFKADMDLCQPMFDRLEVSIIPTFVIFDNKKVIEGLKKSGAQEGKEASIREKLSGDIVAASRVDSLQNSQQATVMTFIEKHCSKLSFGTGDEDF